MIFGNNMTKIEKEYVKEYGDVSKSFSVRLDTLIKALKKERKKVNVYKELQNIRDIEWESIKYTIYLVPKATPRPRINHKMNLFYVSGSDVNKKIFRKFLDENPHPFIYTPMKITVDSYLPVPSSMKANEKVLAELGVIRPISKPDFDNLAKTYSDMIQGSLIYDDALIIEGVSRKWYSTKPRIEVEIKYMKDFDSLFNKQKILPKIGKET